MGAVLDEGETRDHRRAINMIELYDTIAFWIAMGGCVALTVMLIRDIRR